MTTALETRVFASIAHNTYHVEKITGTAHLERDLEVDSLDRMEIALHLEETFNFDIDDECISAWETVADICNDVRNLLGPATGGTVEPTTELYDERLSGESIIPSYSVADLTRVAAQRVFPNLDLTKGDEPLGNPNVHVEPAEAPIKRGDYVNVTIRSDGIAVEKAEPPHALPPSYKKWVARWYGSEPNKGCNIWSVNDYGNASELLFHVGPDEKDLELGRVICETHNETLPTTKRDEMHRKIEQVLSIPSSGHASASELADTICDALSR